MFRVLLLATAASFVMVQASPLKPEPFPPIAMPSIPVPLIHIAPPSMPVIASNVPTVANNRRSPAERVLAANRRALHEPTADNFMDAVQVYPFATSALYRLYAAPQQVCDIALEPGETLSAISAGDTVRWAVGDTSSGSGGAKQVHVMVKPFAPGLKTNLVILTDKRSYHLVLQSTAHVAMASVSWSYPGSGLITEKAGQGAPLPTPSAETGIKSENLDFHYAISGDNPDWKPLRAFDDGQKVYIEFPDSLGKGESPPLFIVGADGMAQLVNYRVSGRYYIVDQMFSAAELRLGDGRQQVVRITKQGAEPHHTFLGG